MLSKSGFNINKVTKGTLIHERKKLNPLELSFLNEDTLTRFYGESPIIHVISSWTI